MHDTTLMMKADAPPCFRSLLLVVFFLLRNVVSRVCEVGIIFAWSRFTPSAWLQSKGVSLKPRLSRKLCEGKLRPPFQRHLAQALPLLSPKVMSRASTLQKKRGNRSVENALTLFQNVRRNLTEAPSFKLCPSCVQFVLFVCFVLRVFPNLRDQNLECETFRSVDEVLTSLLVRVLSKRQSVQWPQLTFKL